MCLYHFDINTFRNIYFLKNKTILNKLLSSDFLLVLSKTKYLKSELHSSLMFTMSL